MTGFSKKLIAWYLHNKRDLPWRNSKDPYGVWLSEIILQQTKIEQGLGYFLRFLEQFPTVFDLAAASEEGVLKLWQGLGYYSRARNLHASARVIVEQYNGVFPESYGAMKNLKGVGDYTASAVASICFNEPRAVVDGNVFRVLSRVFGEATPINTTAGAKAFKTLANELLDRKQPGTHNQALMEFGALACTPKKPACANCIFQKDCVAFQTGKVAELPVKKGKTKVRNRYFHYLVVKTPNKETLLQKRAQKGIWENLYEFPLVETSKLQILEAEIAEAKLQRDDIQDFIAFNEQPILHKLSHQHLYIRFYIVELSKPLHEGTPVKKIHAYPVPVVLQNFIEKYSF